MKKLTIQQLVLDAMLAGMCALLGKYALDMTNLKVTFESLPILLAAFLFGPVDGALVAGVGTFLYQILRYGFSATSFLWILPYVLMGLFAGLWVKKLHFNPSQKQTLLIVAVMELMVTLLNTGVMYIDSKIYGYNPFVSVFVTFFLRFAICIGKAIAFGILLPPLIKALKRVLK